MYRMQKRRQFYIFLIDILLSLSTIWLMLVIRYQEIPSSYFYIRHIRFFYPLVILMIIFMYIFNMYSLTTPFNTQRIVARIGFCTVLDVFCGFALFYLNNDASLTPRRNLLLFLFLYFITLVLWRKLYDLLFIKNKNKPHIIFIDCAKSLPDFIQHLQQKTYLGFVPTALVLSTPNSHLPETDKKELLKKIEALKIPITTNIEDITKFTNQNYVFVYSKESSITKNLQQFFYKEISLGVPFYSYSEFYELVNRQVPLEDINSNWVFQNIDLSRKAPYKVVKRAADVAFSCVALLLTLWFWPLIALLIKTTSKGPVFFTQIREGFAGKQFKIYKFRTMTVADNTFSPTGINDARITPIGNFLRKSRIDEIPQLLNLFLGDMSLIGPRPERPELAIELEKEVPFYRQRLMVTPGITGWDQVSGEYHSPSVEDTRKKLQNDLYYIKNFSFFLDISIIAKTVFTVLNRSGR
ncbi:MAG: hypothetical protein BKP49_06470 [Treponema sp. CETP13]|nr:MAG: hypothetical protein BKP49_06470 [Treponema sp. CETP13]